jgi:hypothetical protein
VNEDRQVSDRRADPGDSSPVPSSPVPSSPVSLFPVPPPREADDWLVTASVTAGWAIALVTVALLSALGVLPPGERWWVWTCAAGFGLGLWGLWYVPVLKRSRARAAARQAQLSGKAPSSVSRDSGSNTVSSTETPGSSTRS